eukprot:symbB.v1.2.009167.t1/scaffold579.1/size184598/1
MGDVPPSTPTVPVRVLQSSGEVAFEARMPTTTTIKELVVLISKEGLGPPSRLILVLGSEIVPSSKSLAELDLKEEDCFQLVRRARSEFSDFHSHSESSVDDSKPPMLVKCVILGPAAAGKSALVAQYCDETFVPTYLPTIGVDFRVGQVATKCEEFRFKLQFWDTAGQERFRTITLSYIQGTSSIMAVFSLEHRKSLEETVLMVNQALRYFDGEDHPREGLLLCLVGTHADSETREVSDKEALLAAEELGCSFHAVSNATGEG